MFILLSLVPPQVCSGIRHFQRTLIQKQVYCWFSAGSQLHRAALHQVHVETSEIAPVSADKEPREIDFSKIRQRLQKAAKDVPEPVLKENWQLLKSMGCLDDHIYCYPEILCIPPHNLIEYSEKIKKLGVTEMSVGLLRLAMNHNKKYLLEKVKKYMADSFNLNAKLIDVVGCSDEELNILLERIPKTMSGITLYPKLMKDKIDLICQNGYTLQDIIRWPLCLRRKYSTLLKRLKKINEIEGLEQRPRLSLLYAPKFEEHIQYLIDHGRLHTDLYRQTKSAEQFQIDKENVILTKQLKQTSLKLTKDKVSVLEEAGFKPKDVMCKPVLLYYSANSIKQAVSFVKAHHVDSEYDINEVINVLQQKFHRKNKEVPERLVKHVTSCLDIDFYSLKKSQKQCLGNASLSTVNENLIFFKQNGFTKSDLRSCPLILVQEPCIVQKSFQEVNELENFKHLRTNNIKFVNALQYHIEYYSKMDDFEEES